MAGEEQQSSLEFHQTLSLEGRTSLEGRQQKKFSSQKDKKENHTLNLSFVNLKHGGARGQTQQTKKSRTNN